MQPPLELPVPLKERHPNLLLHCGASRVERSEVLAVSTPQSTETWTPISHGQLIATVETTLAASNLRIGSAAHSLTHDAQRYFGLMEIAGETSDDHYCWVLGLRNSHDKTFPAGITAGAQVFVCDNLSFSGEVKLARKHTRHILRDLPLLVERAIGKLTGLWHQQETRISAYRESAIDDRDAHNLVIRATDVGVCSNRLIPMVLKAWRDPEFEAFMPRTAWSLFNAFTASLKEGNLAELPKRTEALHGLLDGHVGLARHSSC